MVVLNKDVCAYEFVKGVERKVLAYNEHLMLCEIQISEGAVLAMHSHPHVQVTYVISGRLLVTAQSGETELGAGDSILFESNEPHRVTALEKALVTDTFTPMREDFLK